MGVPQNYVYLYGGPQIKTVVYWGLCLGPPILGNYHVKGSEAATTRLGFPDVCRVPDLGGCQNYGPFLTTLNIGGRIIIGIQKGTIILTTTHLAGLTQFDTLRTILPIERCYTPEPLTPKP